jgi:hypothetical protein
MAAVSQDKHGKGKHEPHYELPDAKALQEAGELMIKDEHGKEVTFKSLYEDKSGTQQLIIFVRHFFCGVCLSYHCQGRPAAICWLSVMGLTDKPRTARTTSRRLAKTCLQPF